PGVLESFNLSQQDAELLILQARVAAGWIDASELPQVEEPEYEEEIFAEAGEEAAEYEADAVDVDAEAVAEDLEPTQVAGWEPQLSLTSNAALIDRDRQDLVSRQVLDESRLIRFVPAPDGSVAPDLARKLPGRGLWVAADRASI